MWEGPVTILVIMAVVGLYKLYSFKKSFDYAATRVAAECRLVYSFMVPDLWAASELILGTWMY